jgi:N-acetylglucosamine-6-sulfatase
LTSNSRSPSHRGEGKRESRGGRIAVSLVLIAAIVVPTVGSPATSATAGSATPAVGRPNVVLIQMDDQTAAQFNGEVMPKTMRLLTRPGTKFKDYIATTPQCCPSRASLLTGQYAHNHGVLSNGKGYAALGGKRNLLPVWLQEAGYNTIHVGKFLNGYSRFADRPADVAPGWTDWRTVIGGRFGYYDYFLSTNGEWSHYGKGDDDYVTRVLTRNAVRAIRRYAPHQAPFYLELDQHAPHASGGKRPGRCSGKGVRAAKPDPVDMDAFRKAPLRRSPSFNEKHIKDKPAFVRSAPRIDRETRLEIKRRWRCALASLAAADRSVATVHDAVRQSGELSNTVFIYISDNGLLFGEHRIAHGKVLPYEENLRLPLIIDLPRGYGGVRKVHEPVANIDLAPTILDLAHAQPCPPEGSCRTMDGRSLMPLLTGTGPWPRHRGLLTEYQSYSPGRYQTCGYDGIRTHGSVYLEHYSTAGEGKCRATLAAERYDLRHDAFELRNLCHGGAIENCPTDGRQARLAGRLQELSRCAGVEGRDERVDDRPFCE